MAESYYSSKLNAERLKLCYELATPSVQRYLAAEVAHVRAVTDSSLRVLELGCGYGRVLRDLADTGAALVGVDLSLASLSMAQRELGGRHDVTLVHMNAGELAFAPGTFDLVICLQNGISAFHLDQRALLSAAVRVTRRGGRVMFSSYAGEFWSDRLEWFRIQSAHGLVGEIDEAATGDGVIVTKDGFTASTVTPEEFAALSRDLGESREITIVAGSSVFCEIRV